MTLSVEYFYPDCEHCGAAGDLYVCRNLTRNATDGSAEWKCHSCGRSFDVPSDSVWCGVWDVRPSFRRAYIDCVIRGLTRAEHAKNRSIEDSTVPAYLRKARRSIENAGGTATSSSVTSACSD